MHAASDHGNVSVASSTDLTAPFSALEVISSVSPLALFHQTVEHVESSESALSRSHVESHVSCNILGSLAFVQCVAEKLVCTCFGSVEVLVEETLALR